MPVFLQEHPMEFRGFYNANNTVAKRLKQANSVSGFIGTPQADVEKFDKVIDMLESLETQLEAYSVSIDSSIGSDFTKDPDNPTKLYTALLNAKKQISKKEFSLLALPKNDIEKINKYIASLETYKSNADAIMRNITTSINLPYPNNLDPDLAKTTFEVLAVIASSLEEIQTLLLQKLAVYNSGVSDYTPDLTGGASCGTYNLDEPLRKSKMYQGYKYV